MRYNDVLERLIRTRRFAARAEMLEVKYCVSTPIGEMFYETIRRNNYTNCLEIGCLFGFSTLFLAQAVDEIGGRLTVVDARIEPINWDGKQVFLDGAAERHVQEAGYASRVQFIWGRSENVLPALGQEGRRFHFALIDGDHRFASALLDLIQVDSMLEVGGAIALDDIGWAMAEKPNLHGCANRVLAHLFATSRYRIEVKSGNVCVCTKLKDVGT
ncbi:MAG: class I SAM-dependent methyltransferase [Planctomycetes bacterium]|nr:class I SAM-dependent methyltransferase [Planctomycetota bacterium]